ncbi:MAG TPA: hypothetical protein VH250_13005 [Granulicella sp.]|jgi:hypothetical protein|nr:hypothetical protein [Granulicella sp.]
MKDTTEVSKGTVEMLKPIAAANWSGLELIPFETIAERFLDLDEDGKQETLTVAFGKPFVIEGKGWGCPYRLTAMGHDRVSLAGGADSVQAVQLAMDMVHNEVSVMARHHKITFRGTSDFGFGRAAEPPAEGAKCPVIS